MRSRAVRNYNSNSSAVADDGVREREKGQRERNQGKGMARILEEGRRLRRLGNG